MARLLIILGVLGCVAAGIFWWLTQPIGLDQARLSNYPAGDATAGERMFWAGGCASCHAAPEAKGDDKKVLAGGLPLKTPFGTFYAPNISSDSDKGIGSWTLQQFANAMQRGVSPSGEHYFPAFPYTSYARMKDEDVASLFLYLKTLPESSEQSRDHDVGFPFNIRRGLGIWKRLYLNPSFVAEVDTSDPVMALGQYLVEGPAHCGACHTPRNAIGGPDTSRWMAGGPAVEGEGRIPNITPHEDGIASWSESEIADSLATGFTPSYDSFGGSMTDVQENMARLTAQDRAAIAAYLKAIPGHPSVKP
ncbi:MAG: c-type cytochrome [Pseudomonadota bacterium]